MNFWNGVLWLHLLAMAFFVGVEIYDHLEKVADRFDDVANEIHGIVLENV